MCLYPKLIKNPKYRPNKKNKGVIPVCTDERTKLIPVGCGRCMECMKQKKRNWQVRLLEEIKTDKSGKFVTLTFNDESLIELNNYVKCDIDDIRENEVATLAVRRFLERWRKDNKISVKHWLITELGHIGSERIHLHGIIFTNYNDDYIAKLWKYGNIYVGNYVNERTINYIIKYVNKMDIEHKGYIPKILCSKGIGSNYIKTYNSQLNKFNYKETKEYYRTRSGHKIAMPTYWRNKIYTDKEREKLWLNKLDENIRYVNGEMINGNHEQGYFNMLYRARKLNKQLGYGDDSLEWDKQEYIKKLNHLKYVNKIAELKKNDIHSQDK